MEILDELINKRMATLETSIVAGEYADKDAFEADLARHVNMLISSAVLSHIKKEDAIEYIQEHFTEVAEQEYDELTKEPDMEMPEDYAFAEQQEEIEKLIAEGKLDEADEKIADLYSILEDEETVKMAIAEGLYTQKDVDYFMKNACPYFEELKDEKIAEMPEELNFFQRVKRGVSFVFTGRNPYDGKSVKVKKEKDKEDSKRAQLIAWAKKHKVALCALGAAALLAGGIFIGKHVLHNKANEDAQNTGDPGIEQNGNVEMATFEVDEFHDFNMNDQETHIVKLELLSKAFVERGVRVVSAEECVTLSNQGILAVTPEQLDNWLISINLEDINDLTFTKLMADSQTDKEELSSDFLRVSNILGSIYTTKEATPFIYEFISSKENSTYIKAYEEAIIQNQQGDKQPLVGLIESRVYNPVSGKSAGPLGMLSTALIYQQANVYNAQVVGQDIMDLYNINNDCKAETETTFYSDDWAEFMRKLNSKIESAIAYTGSETAAYIEYFKTLTDAQNDNKVYVESQVLPFLELNNIQLGEWDLIDEIENNRTVNTQSTGTQTTSQQTVSSPTEVEALKVISKEPTTPEELAVKQETETRLDEQNNQEFKDTVGEYAQENGGQVLETGTGDLIIYIPGQQPIIVDGSTMGAYDASKDYQGTTYTDYGDYSSQHRSEVETVEGVGQVVVTEESQITITNPNVYQDRNGNIIDKTTGQPIITGTQQEIQDIIDRNPGINQWHTVDEGEIHYSEVDNTLPTISQSGYTESTTGSTYTQNQVPASSNPTGTQQNGTGGQQTLYEDESVKVTVSGSTIQQTTQTQQPSILDNVDQDVYQGLTPEEQRELEEMLNAGTTPVPGQIVEESFSDVVYGNYTVPQLMNNPALCKNVPESILKNDFPEIWSVYQNWLAEQAKISAQSQTEEDSSLVAAQSGDVVVAATTDNDISAQIAALEGVKAELTGEGLEAEAGEKTM